MYQEQQEQPRQGLFRGGMMQNLSDKAKHIFNHRGSGGIQSQKLARLTSAFENAMDVIGWDIAIETDKDGNARLVAGKGLVLTTIVKEAQATVGAKYHNDFVKVALAEEITERKKGVAAPAVQMVQK